MSKRIFLTEKQFNYILVTESKLNILSEMVKEEQSINNDVTIKVNEEIDAIAELIRTTEKTELESGVYLQKFKAPMFNFGEYEVNVSVNNYEFKDMNTFKEKFDKYCYKILGSAMSPSIRFKHFHIFLNSCSISGGIRKDITADNLQHEVEHAYQMSLSGSDVPKDKRYNIAYGTLMSATDENDLNFLIALALYYSYPSEHDGFVNGLYQFLQNSDKPMFWLEDVAENSACKAYFQLKDAIAKVESADVNEVSKILKSTYNLTYNKYINFIHKGIKRFGKKIGNVLSKHRKDAIENGAILNESIGGRILFV